MEQPAPAAALGAPRSGALALSAAGNGLRRGVALASQGADRVGVAADRAAVGAGDAAGRALAAGDAPALAQGDRAARLLAAQAAALARGEGAAAAPAAVRAAGLPARAGAAVPLGAGERAALGTTGGKRVPGADRARLAGAGAPATGAAGPGTGRGGRRGRATSSSGEQRGGEEGDTGHRCILRLGSRLRLPAPMGCAASPVPNTSVFPAVTCRGATGAVPKRSATAPSGSHRGGARPSGRDTREAGLAHSGIEDLGCDPARRIRPTGNAGREPPVCDSNSAVRSASRPPSRVSDPGGGSEEPRPTPWSHRSLRRRTSSRAPGRRRAR